MIKKICVCGIKVIITSVVCISLAAIADAKGGKSSSDTSDQFSGIGTSGTVKKADSKKKNVYIQNINAVNSLVRGVYTANDLVDGKITVVSIAVSPRDFIITFSNKKLLKISAVGKEIFEKGKETKVTAEYRGHKWMTTFELITDDICMDDYNQTFFIKFSTDIVLPDCEKNILTFKCSNLLAQFDEPVYVTPKACCL